MIYGYSKILTNYDDLILEKEILNHYGVPKQNIHFCLENQIPKKNRHLELFLKRLHAGDTLVVVRFHSLGSSLNSVIKNISYLNDKNVECIIIRNKISTISDEINWNFTSQLFKILDNLLKSIHQENSSNGLEEAKERGVKLGRKFGLTEEASEKAFLCEQLYRNNIRLSVNKMMTLCGVKSKSTFYRYLKLRGRRKCKVCNSIYWNMEEVNGGEICLNHKN